MNGGYRLKEHWIDGGGLDLNEERIAVVDPTEEVRICDVPIGGEESVNRAVESARRSGWSEIAPRDRSHLLRNLARAVDEHRVELAQMEHRDVGKPISEADAIDVENAIRWLEYAAGWPKRIEGAVLPVDTGHFAYTLREPVGVVAAITAWNYPLMLAVWKLAPALAAGCPVVLKPSERAPMTCLMLGQLASMAGLPNGALNVVTGDGSTGDLLVRHQGVGKVSFTGSVEVGRRVATTAAARGVPCTTELGGKSAAIVLPQHDPIWAATQIVEGICHNAGQACNAPSRLLYSPKDEDYVLSTVERAIEEANGFGPLIDREQQSRVAAFVERALDAGAEPVAESAAPVGYGVPATALLVEDPDAEILREEVFGPVLALHPTDDPVTVSNSSRYDLAAGIFGRADECMRTARELRAGHVYINCWSIQDPCAPFGGMGGSGVGREHGREGLDSFLRTKTVYVA